MLFTEGRCKKQNLTDTPEVQYYLCWEVSKWISDSLSSEGLLSVEGDKSETIKSQPGQFLATPFHTMWLTDLCYISLLCEVRVMIPAF